MSKMGVGLIRVSTGAQADEDRASIPAQREIIRHVAAQHGIQVLKTFELADISGAAVLFSSEYRSFLKYLEHPDISCVITREFSRLMRPDRFEDFAIIQHFVDHGITLYFPNEVLDLANRQARFMAALRAGISGLERGDIAERVATAKEVLRKKGYHPCGEQTLALGVGHTKQKGWYYDEAEMSAVRLLFRLFLDGCHVYKTLSEKTGIPRTSIPVILRNPVYTGWMVYSKRNDLSAAGLVPPTYGRKGYRRKIDRAEDEVIRVHVPLDPVITADEHRRIVEIVESKRQHWTSTRANSIPRFTYRGFLSCGNCGAPLYTWAAQNGKDFYHCKANLPRYRQKGARCTNRHMSRHLLEPILDRILVQYLANSKFLTGIIESHMASLESALPLANELTGSRIEILQKQRKRVLEAFFALNIDQLEKEERLSVIDNEIDMLREAMATEPRRVRFDLNNVISIVSVFRDWTLLDMSSKREIMSRVLPEIFVHCYRVRGVNLRVGYNNDNPPRTADAVITGQSTADFYRETTICVPFTEEQEIQA